MKEVTSKAEIAEKLFSSGVSESNLQKINGILSGKDEKENENSQDGKYMSIKETCKYMAGISRVTLWSCGKKGLKSYRIGGRRAYKMEDVDKWIREQK